MRIFHDIKPCGILAWMPSVRVAFVAAEGAATSTFPGAFADLCPTMCIPRSAARLLCGRYWTTFDVLGVIVRINGKFLVSFSGCSDDSSEMETTGWVDEQQQWGEARVPSTVRVTREVPNKLAMAFSEWLCWRGTLPKKNSFF